MKKFFTLLLVLLFAVAACDLSGEKQKKKDREREVPGFTIGVNLPLTGNGSYFAEEFKKGFEMAASHFNSKSNRLMLNVIYEDNKLNPKDAVSITKKFLEVDQVDLIVCGYTPLIQATAGLAERAGMPMIATLSSAEEIARPYQWVFRDFPLESDNMPLLAEYAKHKAGLGTGSWLVINDDMGLDAVRFFNEKFESLGGKMVEGEVFEPSEMDLRNKISKVLEKDPDFLIVIGRGAAMMNAFRQIRETEPGMILIGNNTVDNETFWDAIGESGNNILFPRPYTDLMSNRYIQANERFRSQHGYDMNYLNIYGMSTANYLARAFLETGGDRQSLRAYLDTLDHISIRGRLRMNDANDVIVPNVVIQRIDGISEPVWIPQNEINE